MGHGGITSLTPTPTHTLLHSYITEQANFHFMSCVIGSVLRIIGLLAQRDLSDKNLIVFMSHLKSSNMNLMCLCCF